MSSKYPVQKEPTMEPMELINNMKEISPMVAPTRSAKSSRVGPITPEVRPRALRKYEGVCLSQVKLPKKMLRSSIVLLSRCQGYFSTFIPDSKGIFSSSLLSIFINFGGESFTPCLFFCGFRSKFLHYRHSQNISVVCSPYK